ncbi:MAG: hypothetical protein BZ138_07845 [Methanosphaera sp. rholeuAM270]|nr:MAG: hypothetical protein BZ138_07845 [Methanosphaera sp. rholeuAM270]
MIKIDVYAVITPVEQGVLHIPSNFCANLMFIWNEGSYEYFKDRNNLNILIDSGAYYYNYHHQEGDRNHDQFINQYYEFIYRTLHDKKIKAYVELDLMFLGFKKILELREELFSITDRIIPVYHANTPKSEFKRMVKKYNYVAISCSKNINFPQSNYKYYVSLAHKYDCKIHGLGLNNKHVMTTVPFDSCDSSTYIMEGYSNYYYSCPVEKNPENNAIYRPIYSNLAFRKQLSKQIYYKKFWDKKFEVLK